MSATKTKTVQRLVSGLFASYRTTEGDVEVIKTGQRGEIIDVSEVEAERLDKLGSVIKVDDADLDLAARQRKLDEYRALRGDAEAVEAVQRAVAPTDPDLYSGDVQPHVSPPPMGATPRGEVVTGDTGGPDTPAPTATPDGPAIVRGDSPDPSTATVGEIAGWISAEKVNVSDTVALAEGDPVFAAKVLEAENSATGGDPRKGVVDGLTKILDA